VVSEDGKGQDGVDKSAYKEERHSGF